MRSCRTICERRLNAGSWDRYDCWRPPDAGDAMESSSFSSKGEMGKVRSCARADVFGVATMLSATPVRYGITEELTHEAPSYKISE